MLSFTKRLTKLILPYGMVRYIQTWPRRKAQKAYRQRNLSLLKKMQQTFPNIPVIEEIADRSSGQAHAVSPEHIQFWFASNRLSDLKPEDIYDIGSHRAWLLGVGATCRLHTLDVRGSELVLNNERAHVGRAEELPYEDNSIECITSLCSLEHFGLGSYGDTFDPLGDTKAMAEVKRVLKPGGHYIFTTCLTGGESFIVFNTRRVYSLKRIHQMLEGDMICVEEKFFSMRQRKLADETELIRGIAPYNWDLYLGDWQKVVE